MLLKSAHGPVAKAAAAKCVPDGQNAITFPACKIDRWLTDSAARRANQSRERNANENIQYFPPIGVAWGLTVAAASGLKLPYWTRPAWAGAEEDRIAAAANAIAEKADINGMIWSNYMVPMQPAAGRFEEATGIGVGNIQDISIFDIPQRAMAEALSRSPNFDFFHVDSNMIPSLVSAGLLEPLDGPTWRRPASRSTRSATMPTL